MAAGSTDVVILRGFCTSRHGGLTGRFKVQTLHVENCVIAITGIGFMERGQRDDVYVLDTSPSETVPGWP